VLAVAPNGARRTHRDHAAIPLTAEAMGETARACLEAGAALLHLHVRRADGRHLLDADAYRQSIAAIRQAVGDELIVQVTTEAVGLYSPQQQEALVRALAPEAVSLAVRELVADAAAEARAARFFAWLAEQPTFVQFIVYSAEDLRRFDDLLARGVIPGARHSLLFVLGRYSQGQRSDPLDLLPFLQANERDHCWAVCAFGGKENSCAAAALAFGGHVRVGFENNLYLPNGQVAPNNAALIQAAADAAAALARPLATAAQARQLFARLKNV
jgi:uncharacterized protein (DUF849 family)